MVRALYEAASALGRIERRKAQPPQKTGEPWSGDEHGKLLGAFDAGARCRSWRRCMRER